jgi:hypothetical protein
MEPVWLIQFIPMNKTLICECGHAVLIVSRDEQFVYLSLKTEQRSIWRRFRMCWKLFITGKAESDDLVILASEFDKAIYNKDGN